MVVNLNLILMFLMFVEFFIDFLECIEVNGFLKMICEFVIGEIRNIWLCMIEFKFWKDRCSCFRYVISFFFFVGLKIVRMFIFFNDGVEKKVKNVWLFFFFIMIYFCNVLIVF